MCICKKIRKVTRNITKKDEGGKSLGDFTNNESLLCQKYLHDLRILKSVDNEIFPACSLLLEAWKNYLLSCSNLTIENEQNSTLRSLLDNCNEGIPQKIKDFLLKIEKNLNSGSGKQKIKKKDFRKSQRFLERKVFRGNKSSFCLWFIKKIFLFIFSLLAFIAISYLTYQAVLYAQYFLRAPWQVNVFPGQNLQKMPLSSYYSKKPYLKDFSKKTGNSPFSVRFKSCLTIPFDMDAIFSFKSQSQVSFYVDENKIYSALSQGNSSIGAHLLAGTHEIVIEFVGVKTLRKIDFKVEPQELQNNFYQLSNRDKCE